jgi:hypothetical protein
MKAGDKVRVWPHGDESQAAIATVALISANGCSIAVGFEEMPPFAFSKAPVIGIHPEFGVMMMASRQVLNGKPWGPWVEMAGGGHYEIEETNDAAA